MTAAREMIAAEWLKLRKRRALFWWCLILTVAPIVVIDAILEILHIVNEPHHGPAGGTDNFSGSMQALVALGALVAVLIGSTAGAGDVGAGVFRDLVTTGRSRVVLFLVRLPGAMLMLVPFLLAGYVIELVVTYGLAGDLDTPSAGVAAHFGVYLLAGRLTDLAMALGLAALISSRGITIGVLLAWQFAIGPILASITIFGIFREFVSSAASDALRPIVGDDQRLVGMSIGAAVLVLCMYAAVFLALGAWRTATEDA